MEYGLVLYLLMKRKSPKYMIARIRLRDFLFNFSDWGRSLRIFNCNQDGGTQSGDPFLLGSNVYPYPAQPFYPTLVALYWVHNPKIKNQITTFVICLGTSLIKKHVHSIKEFVPGT